mgnify:CR=1 FL=1
MIKPISESPALSLSFFLLLFSFSTPPPPQSILLDSLYPLQQKSNKKLTLIPLVAALKSLQNAMMFRPACPSAGPTGGAGLACPAPIRRRMEAEMAFLDILVNSIQARKREKRERWRLFSSRASESESGGKCGDSLTAKISRNPPLLLTTQFAGHSKQAFLFPSKRKQPTTTFQRWRPPRSRPTGSAMRSRVSVGRRKMEKDEEEKTSSIAGRRCNSRRL